MIEHYKNLSLIDIKETVEGIEYSEEWKNIVGYDGMYQVSNMGRVKSMKRYLTFGKTFRIVTEKIRKIMLYSNGYCFVQFSDIHKVKLAIMIHRLVATHFIDNPEKKPQVNHKKGIKTDNRFHQLEWNTKAENIQHAATNLGVYGENWHASKINIHKAREIRSKYPKMTLKQLSKEYGISFANIGKVVRGETWKESNVSI